MQTEDFFEKLNNNPNSIEFTDTMELIDTLYDFTPTAFSNGKLKNETGQNSGSCKLFCFAQLHKLNQQQTLACFGAYYRQDVLQHPDNTDHQNIRNFINTGWHGIHFAAQPLREKN